MPLRPLGDRIVIKRNAPETHTFGGVLLPDKAQTKPLTGVVLAVGPGKDKPIVGVTAGDVVMYKAWTGEDVPPNIAGESDIVVINKDDLWGVVV